MSMTFSRRNLLQMLTVLDAALPARPRGWLGPGLSETRQTPTLLAEAGFTHLLDWCADDQPFPLTVPGYGSPTQRLRFVAAGIGITPILPMMRHVDRLGVEWSMIYSGRSRDSLPFLDEVAEFGDRIEIRTDDVHGVPTAAQLLGDCPDGTAVYACGPAPLLTAIRAGLAGRDNVELHFERFGAPPVIDGEEFSVRVASTGATVQVGAEETLLSALQRSDVWPSYSCRQGFCGTCRTRVLEGHVDHRDTLLTEPERADGMMLICISRAAEGQRLTLDL